MQFAVLKRMTWSVCYHIDGFVVRESESKSNRNSETNSIDSHSNGEILRKIMHEMLSRFAWITELRLKIVNFASFGPLCVLPSSYWRVHSAVHRDKKLPTVFRAHFLWGCYKPSDRIHATLRSSALILCWRACDSHPFDDYEFRIIFYLLLLVSCWFHDMDFLWHFFQNYLCVPWCAPRDTATMYLSKSTKTHTIRYDKQIKHISSNSRMRDGSNNGRWWLSSQQWTSQASEDGRDDSASKWFLIFDVALCGIYWCSDMRWPICCQQAERVCVACAEQPNSWIDCAIDLAVNTNI